MISFINERSAQRKQNSAQNTSQTTWKFASTSGKVRRDARTSKVLNEYKAGSGLAAIRIG
jgi:hypothetical protein